MLDKLYYQCKQQSSFNETKSVHLHRKSRAVNALLCHFSYALSASSHKEYAKNLNPYDLPPGESRICIQYISARKCDEAYVTYSPVILVEIFLVPKTNSFRNGC